MKFLVRPLVRVAIAVLTALAAACNWSPHAGSSVPALDSSVVPPSVVPGSVAPTVDVPRRPLHIALVLGGGAARGFAHVGVIKALEARGIVPDIIVGTSAGSLVGALYAGGYDGIELNRLALGIDEAALSDWALPSRGLFKGESLQNYVNHALHDRTIEKLDRKFAVTATDLQSGELVVFERGNTGQAVRASSSVPGIFQPVHIGSHDYVDGGLVSPVPVRVARRLGADVVIAVDISARPANADTSGLLAVLMQTFAIMGKTIGSYEEEEADVVIKPDMAGMAGTDFASRNAAVLAGEAAVSASADGIRQVIEARRRELNAL